MGTPIYALVVDDSMDETQQIIDALGESGYDPVYERVDELEGVASALYRQKWDIAIAEYALPGFNGVDALKMIKEAGLDLPLIIIFKAIGEKAAVQAIKAGVYDLVPKSDLNNLPQVIEQALAEAGERRDYSRKANISRRQELDCRLLLDCMDEAVTQAEIVYNAEGKPTDWVILDANPAHTAMTGISREKAVGQLASKVYGQERMKYYLPLFAKVATTERPIKSEVYSPFTKRHYVVRVFSSGKGRFATVSTDVTEYKQTVESLRKANRTLRAHSAVNQAIARAVDEPSLLRATCHIVSEIGGYHMAWIGFAEHDKMKHVHPECSAGSEAGYLDSVEITWSNTELGRGPTGTAIRTGEPYVCDISTDPCYAPWREESLKRGYASMLALPLIAHGKTLGTLDVYSSQSNAFDEDEVKLLTDLADDLAYGIALLRTREKHVAAEEALRQSEQRYRRIVTTAQEGIIEFDLDCKVTYVNQRMADMLGYTVEELAGHGVHHFMDEPARREAQWHLDRCRKGTEERFELRLRRQDGSELWTIMSTTPIYEDGQLSGTLGMVADITDLKTAERERAELDAHKREFYQRTILAATAGKLIITEQDEVLKMAGPPIASWHIEALLDSCLVRQEVAEMAESAGMDESRVDDFVLCVGEATSNSIKYAGGGEASLHHTLDGMLFLISDRGPGIQAMALPEIAFRKGYTTAVSLGMGYKEMLALADRVYLASGPQGTIIAIEMAYHAEVKLPELAALPETW